ncbi:MAG: hypothetical protein ACI4HQ_11620 [Acetatifactor sp.]
MKKGQRSITSHIRHMVILDIVVLVLIMEICSVVSIRKALVTDTHNEISMKTENGATFIDNWLKKKASQTEIIAASFKAMPNISDDAAEAYLPHSYVFGRVMKAVIFVALSAVIVSAVCIVTLAVILKKQLGSMNTMKSFIKETVVGQDKVPYYKHEEEEIRKLSDETGNEINKVFSLSAGLLYAVDTLTKETTDTVNKMSSDIKQAYEKLNELAGRYKASAEYYSAISADLGASQDIQGVAADAVSMKDKVEQVSVAVDEVSATVQQFNV